MIRKRRPSKERSDSTLPSRTFAGGRWSRLAWRAVAFVLLAASGGTLAWRACPPPVRRETGQNVLLVTVDTLRADALGAYGQARDTSPWIDRLARQGVRFDQARAHNTMTLPSHANILSGLLPFEHGVRDNSGFRFPAQRETLATLLAGHGYRTAAFLSAVPLDSRFGLDRGFEVYDDAFRQGRSASRLQIPARSAAETVKRAERWIAAARDRPWFVWVHLFDPHAPYEAPEPWASAYRDAPYLGEVAATDAALRGLIEPLLAEGRECRTLVALTADHGESLGEHNERTHGVFGYEATLRVPLLLFAPRLLSPRTVRTPVGHVDLLPTILDALALPVPENLSGHSVLPLATGHQEPPRATYFEALTGMLGRGWAPLYGIVSDGWKYVDLPIAELYDLGHDTREQRNLAASDSVRVGQLRGALGRMRERDRSLNQRDENAATRQQLAALGYLTSAVAPIKSRYTEEDDPKRLIHLDDLMQQALARQRAGDLRGAIDLVGEIVRKRPEMAMAHVVRALLEREAGRLDLAVVSLERAVTLNREDTGTIVLLASCLSDSGRAAQALALLAPYNQAADTSADVWAAQGVALAQMGRRRDALNSFERSRSADPTNAMTLVQIGTVHLTAGDNRQARIVLDEALQIDSGLALAHHHLGLIALAEGDLALAERRLREALAGDPEDADSLLNLGRLLARADRRPEARALLTRFLAAAPPDLYQREMAWARSWLARNPNPPEPRSTPVHPKLGR